MASILGSHSQKGPITLTLVKFSQCILATHSSNNSAWKHHSGQNDLFWVFDSIRRMDVSEQIVSKDVFKVIYRQDLLEHVELDSLRTQARSDDHFIADSRKMVLSMVRPETFSVSLRYRLADNRIRKLQGTFLNKRAYDTCIGIFETYEIPFSRTALTTRPVTMSIPPAVPLELSSSRPRPASAQEITSRPAVPLPAYSRGQKGMSNMHTSNDSQTAAVLAHSTLSQVWQPNGRQLQPPSQRALSSRHTPMSQPSRPNPSRLWQSGDSQSHSSSQQASSSHHTTTLQPVWVPSSSQGPAQLSQVWQPGNSQPEPRTQHASSSHNASEWQRVWVPSTAQPPPRHSQGSDNVFRNTQAVERAAIGASLAHDDSMVMDSMASSQASKRSNTPHPPQWSPLSYLPTSDLEAHCDATRIQSSEKKASERQLQRAHETSDTLKLPLPTQHTDCLPKFAPQFPTNSLLTSEFDCQPTKLTEEVSDGLEAHLPVQKAMEDHRPGPPENSSKSLEGENTQYMGNQGQGNRKRASEGRRSKKAKAVETASNVPEDRLAQDVTNKAQSDQKRASQVTRSKAQPVLKRTRAATQATGADSSGSKVATSKIGKIEKDGDRLQRPSAPPVVPLKRGATCLDDASTTDASSSGPDPTSPSKPAHGQDPGERPEEIRSPLQEVPVNSQIPKAGKSVDEQRAPDTEDHTQALCSLNDIHHSLDAFLSKNHQLLAPDPPRNTFREQMAHFGALPKEERAKVVDKMIMEALMDPDFEKLCQAVEGSFKRFAFEV